MCVCVDGMAAQWAATPMNISAHTAVFSGFSETHPKFYYWRSLKPAQTKWKMRTIYLDGFVCVQCLDTATLWLTYPRCGVHVIYSVRRLYFTIYTENTHRSLARTKWKRYIRLVIRKIVGNDRTLNTLDYGDIWVASHQLCNYFRFCHNIKAFGICVILCAVLSNDKWLKSLYNSSSYPCLTCNYARCWNTGHLIWFECGIRQIVKSNLQFRPKSHCLCVILCLK